MKLAHLPLPSLTPYLHASQLQDRLVRALLASKSSTNVSAPSTKHPTIITAQFHPVYTCGRREVSTVSAETQAYLRANGLAEFHEALRGGQTTFHGPGQLVAYPVIDLKRHTGGSKSGLTARAYIGLLEESVIATCKRYGIRGFRTENPGVWTTEDHKICAVGVHMRRNVSSHGIGLNVCTDMWWFERIVACGLEGKSTTSLEREGVKDVSVEEVGRLFVEEFAANLGLEGVYKIDEGDVPP